MKKIASFFIIIFCISVHLPLVAQERSAQENYDLGTACWHKEEYRAAVSHFLVALDQYKEAGDTHQTAFVAYLIGLCEFRSGICGEALEYYLMALTYAKEADDMETMMKCYEAITNAYFYLGDYVSAKQIALEAQNLARERDGYKNSEARFACDAADAGKKLGDTLFAVEYYGKAIEIYRQQEKETEVAMVQNNIASVYADGSPEKLAAFQEAATMLEGITPPTEKSLTYLAHTYMNMAIWYSTTGDHQAARSYNSKALEFADKSNNGYRTIFVYTRAVQYYYDTGNYGEAKRLAEQTIKLINTHVGKNHSFDIALKILSDIYAKEGNYRKAYETLHEWSVVNDSIQAKSRREELEKINRRFVFESHRQDKLATQELDIERHKSSIQRQRNMILSLIFICLLFLCVGVVIYIYSRRLRVKNLSLIERIAEQDKLEQRSEALRKEMARLAAVNTEAITEKEKGSNLYLKLKELMSDPEVFTDSSIDRKVIAERLHTNEKYVADTIREYYDTSVSEYIMSLRLGYARRLLTSSDENYTVEGVALDAGFSGRSTFHRLFKKRYGMTPHEFRKLRQQT